MADLLHDCMADLQQHGSPQDFQATFCERCRNRGCDHAKWATDRFAARTSTQVERLFHTPQADPTSSRYAMLADFKDMLETAVKLEVADRRGDWSVPEIPVLDGRVEVAPSPTMNAVDDAVRSLHRQNNPEVTEEQIRETSPEVIREAEQLPALAPLPKANLSPVPLTPKVGNTPVPRGGIMIGGSAPAPTLADDPWAVKPDAPRRVEPGAHIKLGGSSSAPTPEKK